MSTRAVVASLANLPLLAACGGGAGNGPGDGLLFTPAYEGVAADTGALEGAGVTGFVAGQDGKVLEARVRLSADHATAYVSLSDGSELAISSPSTAGCTADCTWDDGTHSLVLSGVGGGVDMETTLDGTTYGYTGHWTPPEMLSGTSAYNGFFEGSGPNASISGSFQMSVDFATSTIGGTVSGYVALGPSGSPTYSNDFGGAIEGTVSGSVIAGSFPVDPLGTLDFKGAIMNGGINAVGAFGGTLTDTGIDYTVGGSFAGDAS